MRRWRKVVAPLVASAIGLLSAEHPVAAADQRRVAGADRYATAAALSSMIFTTGVPVAYVATGRDYPDALAAGPSAAMGGGPVLLVQRDSIPVATANELSRLRPNAIVVLGGTGAVSDGVAQSLTQYTTGAVTRIAGADRFETAAALSRATFASGSQLVYLALGSSYADALTAGAAGASNAAPVLLLAPAEIPRATAGELQRLNAQTVVLIGGSSAIAAGVQVALERWLPADVRRIAGTDRYATAVAVSQDVHQGPTDTTYVATGANFPDALAGAATAVPGVALLLAPPTCMPAAVSAELDRLGAAHEVLLGGEAALNQDVAAHVACPAAPPPDASGFRAPTPTSPADGAEFDVYPRMTEVAWSPVDGASWYEVEWQWGQVPLSDWRAGPAPIRTTSTNATFEFIGAQPGRWRVRALAPGRTTDWSPWQVFFYDQ